jgi:seryl-tRNA synthetase
MLDIRFLRENPEIVKQNIKNKFQDSKLPLVDEVIALDIRNREIKQEVEGLRAEKNKISKQIGANEDLQVSFGDTRYAQTTEYTTMEEA